MISRPTIYNLKPLQLHLLEKASDEETRENLLRVTTVQARGCCKCLRPPPLVLRLIAEIQLLPVSISREKFIESEKKG